MYRFTENQNDEGIGFRGDHECVVLAEPNTVSSGSAGNVCLDSMVTDRTRIAV